MSALVLAVPGDIDKRTGGYAYDRRIRDELGALGWSVDTLMLPAAYPRPAQADEAEAGRMLAALADNTLVMVDGLAFGAMAEIAEAERDRLRLVALCHHPLALESGLSPDEAAGLQESEKRALAAARLVIATSHTTARGLTERFAVAPGRIVVAEPGTEPATPAARIGAPPVLLAVGSIIPRKGYDTLVDALARIATSPWRCRIVGGGEAGEVGALRERIRTSGLAERIELAGEVADIAGEYAGADMFVLPSRHEGFGMAFAEAMAHGLPVVGCRIGAVPEVVPDDAGLLVPPDSPDALAAAIVQALEEPGLADALAAGARRRAASLPTWAGSARTIAEALSRL